MNNNESRSDIVSNLKRLVQELGSARSQLQESIWQLQEQLQSLPEDFQYKEIENSRLQEEVAKLFARLGIPVGGWLSRISAWRKKLFGKSPGLEKQIQQLESELTAQKELSAQANLDTQNLQDEIVSLHLEKKVLVGQLETTTGHLQSEILGQKNQIAALENELEIKRGLLLRYEQENAQLNDQLLQVQEASQYAMLIDLIGQITPKRMAFLLENVENLQADSEVDLIKAAKRLCSYLNQLGLRPVHKSGEHIRVNEDQLSGYLLDEKFSPDANFEVISPGFKIGGDLLVKPKIQSFEG